MSASRRTAPASLGGLWKDRVGTAAVSDAVYATIREAIVTGVLAPGSRLAEEDLAGQFAVSRTPVREAVLRLEAERLATRAPRRGLIVARVTTEEILDVYVVRQTIDGLAARLAAESARPADLIALGAISDRFAAAASAEDAQSMATINLELHEAICRIGRNELLLFFLQQIHDRVRRFPGTTFVHPGRPRSAVEEHREVLEAIRSRDADQAEALARRHMAAAMTARIALLQAIVEAPV